MQILVNGAILELLTGELVESVTYMDGFLLGVIVRRAPGFRATLCRVWPRTFDAPVDLPEIWSRFGIDNAICGTIEDGLRILRERVEALEDQEPLHYQFRKSERTSWPSA